MKLYLAAALLLVALVPEAAPQSTDATTDQVKSVCVCVCVCACVCVCPRALNTLVSSLWVRRTSRSEHGYIYVLGHTRGPAVQCTKTSRSLYTSPGPVVFHFDLLVSPTCFRHRQTSQRLNRYQDCTNIDLYFYCHVVWKALLIWIQLWSHNLHNLCCDSHTVVKSWDQSEHTRPAARCVARRHHFSIYDPPNRSSTHPTQFMFWDTRVIQPYSARRHPEVSIRARVQ